MTNTDVPIKVVFWLSTVLRIGGCETWAYIACKHLSKYYNVLFIYRHGDSEQLQRIEKYVPVLCYDPNTVYECDIFIIGSTASPYLDNVISNRIIQFIHADLGNSHFLKWTYQPQPQITDYVAVSEQTAQSFSQRYNKECKVLYNMMDEIQPDTRLYKKPLKLLSATRLTKEKGYQRMQALANILKESGLPFEWNIYTDLELITERIPYEEVHYHEPVLDIYNEIRDADYGVQLSDTESFCYFAHECLQYGTPVIITDFPVSKEIVNEGINGYILKMDLSNLDIGNIYNNIPTNFEYEPKSSIKDWFSLLGKPVEHSLYIPQKVRVHVCQTYYDKVLGRKVLKDEQLDVSLNRAQELSTRNNGLHKQLVEIIA